MGHHRRTIAVFALVVAGVLTAQHQAGSRRPPKVPASPEAVCAFRTAGLSNLWEAADQTTLSAARIAEGDEKAARAAGKAARRALGAEVKRVSRGATKVLPRADARALARTVKGLRRESMRATRKLHSGSTAGALTGSATSIRAHLATVLGAGCTLVGELHVSRVVIAAGEVRHVPAGTTIVADDGMEIAGEIVADGGGGDLTLRAESGDILILGGAVRIESASSGARIRPALSGSGSPRAAPPGPSAGGASTFLQAVRGNVNLARDPTTGQLPHVVAGPGPDGVPRIIGGATQTPLEGNPGGDGGGIVIQAFGGSVTLPTDRRPGEEEVFSVGTGGFGGGLEIDPNAFSTGLTTLTLVGGNGGRSGQLVIQGARMVTGRADAVGLGGWGGSVLWDFRNVGSGFPAEFPRTFSLQVVTLVGGRGGHGLSDGGNGGIARHYSGAVINKRGAPITGVELLGGRGGDVFGAPPPIVLINARGGVGGWVAGSGNAGWSGGVVDQSTRIPNGAKGGAITARGGDGGDILADVHATFAAGGEGGDGSLDQSPTGEVSSILGGPGGDGLDTCDGCAGGNGGDSGDVVVRGGAGGSVSPSAVLVPTTGVLASLQPGKGGSVSGLLGNPFRGNAGDGNPPGTPGQVGNVTAQPGRGGVARGSQKGDDGAVTGEYATPQGGAAGQSCGETQQCCSGPSCQQCCPKPCREREPLNTSQRTITYQSTGPDARKVIAVYDPCGNRDQFGNCAGKYTFTCSDAQGASVCNVGETNGITAPGRNILLGGVFCGAAGVLCSAGPATNCTLFGGTTVTCLNCGDQPVCDAEEAADFRCLNFDHTAPGTTLVYVGERCNLPRCP